MDIKLQVFNIILAVSFFGFIFNYLRKGVLDLKYSLIWLVTSGLIVLFSVFPKIVFWFTHLIGIETPINTLFLFAIFFLLVISFLQNIIISRLNERIKKMAQEIAIFANQRLEEKN